MFLMNRTPTPNRVMELITVVAKRWATRKGLGPR